MHGVISSGNPLTSEAGAVMLRQGGNAFDAAIAAVFASFVTEPMLTSAAGGGMAVLGAGQQPRCVDMAVNYPGLEGSTNEKPVKAVVDFGGAKQIFYLGYPSLAASGLLQGLLQIHTQYGSLPLQKIVAPAQQYAESGITLTPFQAYVNHILEPMCTYTAEARAIFTQNGKLLTAGETIHNRSFGRFLEQLGRDPESALQTYMEQAAAGIKNQPTSLGKRDLEGYRVAERPALKVAYRGHDVYTTTPPSSGGILLAYSLQKLGKSELASIPHNGPEHITAVIHAMQAADRQRSALFFKSLLYEPRFEDKLLGNTTQVSVVDGENNAIGITTSNGQGAGILAGTTGIMHNNFLGEEDLMEYAELYRPGGRMTTMVAPTLIQKDGSTVAVLGSGGSKRIRSAILQAIVNRIDFEMPPEQAVSASRIHYDGETLQLEGGINPYVAKELEKTYRVNLWEKKNMYFGGVHMATTSGGGGDARREGSVIKV